MIHCNSYDLSVIVTMHKQAIAFWLITTSFSLIGGVAVIYTPKLLVSLFQQVG